MAKKERTCKNCLNWEKCYQDYLRYGILFDWFASGKFDFAPVCKRYEDKKKKRQ